MNSSFDILFFHPAPYHYKMDFFKAIAQNYKIYVAFYSEKTVAQHKWTGASLFKNINFPYSFLKTIYIKGIPLSYGIYHTIKKVKPKVIVAHEFSVPTLFAFFISRILKIKFGVGTDGHIKSNLGGFFRTIIKKLICKYSEFSVAFNELSVPYLNSFGMKSEKIILAPQRINDTEFMKKVNRLQIAKKPNEKKQLLFLGRLEEYKGVGKLVDLFLEAGLSQYCTLTIVGSGSLYPRIEAKVNSSVSSGIKLVKEVPPDAVVNYYLNADAFILPSFFEPYGLVVLEALLSNRPVLCSKLAGVAKLASQYSGNILFDPTDNQDYIEGIKTIVNRKIDEATTMAIKRDLSFKQWINTFCSEFNNKVLCI